MEIKTVDKQQMEALKFLAETNLKIGEAKTLLQTLQEDETKYLVGRENKVLARISVLLDDSAAILAESSGNYEKVKELYEAVCSFADLLAHAHDDFKAFEEQSLEKIALEEARLRNIEGTIADQRQQINVDRVKIENWTKSLNQREEKLIDDTRKVASDRAAVDNAIKRLREGRI